MTTIPTTTYGVHLTLRVSGIEQRSALEGAPAISELLTTLVKRVGMRILAGPLVGEEQGDPERRGWSGVVILYESHAAIHTYPELGEAFLDIFSCRDFEVGIVTTMLNEFFGSYSVVEQNLFDRGIHWEADVTKEMDAWLARR